nr:MAG TPA: Microsomal signal peptidase 12 kDa subunit (SPC12) [Caudoviricetes sp.]
MTIGMIVLVILGVLVLGFSIGAIIYGFICDEVETGVGIFAAGLVIGFFLIISPIVYSNTAAGKRAYKDQQSNFMEYTIYKPTGPICISRCCPKCRFTEVMTDEGLTVIAGKNKIMFTFFPLCVDGRIEAQEMIDEYRKEIK